MSGKSREGCVICEECGNVIPLSDSIEKRCEDGTVITKCKKCNY